MENKVGVNRNEELISIVVPVYNVEKYLKKCVDSICCQTYRNLEIILVDDGSPDHCGEMCDEWTKLDDRIVVVHKPNGGLSDARNAGIDIAKGKYISFIDSDDWIRNDYIENLYKVLTLYDTEYSECSFQYVMENGELINSLKDSKSTTLFENKEALCELMRSEVLHTSAWGKLYKKELFDSNRYPKGKLFEDIPVTYDIILSGAKVAYIESASYFYLFRETAISKMCFSPKRMDAAEFMEAAMKKAVSRYSGFKEQAELALFRTYYTIWLSFSREQKESQYYIIVCNKLKEYRKTVLKWTDSDKKTKCKALLTFLPQDISKNTISVHRSKKKIFDKIDKRKR